MNRNVPAWTAILTLTLAVAAMTPTAARADELPPTSQFFEEFDTNADGRVTQEEFRGSREIFKLLDKNADGTITPDDLGLPADFRPDPKKVRKAPDSGPAATAPRGGPRDRQREQLRARLEAMDTDGDGKITPQEWTGPEGTFERLDRNKDGVIDAKDRRGAGGPRRGGAGAGTASPEQLEKRAREVFARLDKDRDGKLAGEEIPNPRLLEAGDKDGDGAVSEAEFLKAHVAMARRQDRGAAGGRGRARMTTAMLKRWDGDGDGKVSAEEFPGREPMFKILDTDKDGFLTETDVAALRERRQPARPRRGEAAPDKPVTQPARPLGAMDKDGDGRLHRGEFTGSAEDWKRLDRNQDGWITPDEMK